MIALQAVVEVEHHLVQRQLVDEHGAAAGVGEVFWMPAPVLAELEDGAEVLVGDEDGRLDPRLLDVVDARRVRACRPGCASRWLPSLRCTR